MFSPFALQHQVVIQLLKSGAIVPEHCMAWALHWEAKDVCAVWLHHAVLDREALCTHQQCQRIFFVCTDCADVVLGVARVNARCRVHQLADCSTWLHSGDGHRLVDAQLVSPFLVGGNGCFLHGFEPLACFLAGVAQDWMVHDAGQRNTQQTLFDLVVLPDVTHVAELCQQGLVGADDGGYLNLVDQVLQCVFLADHHFGQVADTSTAKRDLRTGIDAHDLGRITTT